MPVNWFRAWRRRGLLRRERLPAGAWHIAERALPVLKRLDAAQRGRLADLAVLFLHEKRFEAVAGAALQPDQMGSIALQASLPLLGLRGDWYRPWTTVLVYPGGFLASREYEDEFGVVHQEDAPLIGEAWEGGPLILSLEDAVDPEPGTCVVIHECAHKLDMREGAVNGLPPLPREMPVERWAAAFEGAYNALREAEARGKEPMMDPYAAEDPGEFFAVAVETFYADPAGLREAFPEVYGQLRAFFAFDPLTGAEGAVISPSG